jgi:transcriptional regulator with XRE-family HTH domain
VPRSQDENNQLKKLGANIRRERMAKGITQERLAEMVGLNIRNIQKIEAGETNVLITTLIRIRKALGCSPEKLVPRE